MVDFASLKATLSGGLSLANYIGGGKADIFETIAKARTTGLAATQAILEQAASTQGSGVSVSLSAEAQAILKGKNADGSANPALSGVQKGAADFFMSFFDDSDIDLTRLSGETLKLIKGFQDVIADSGAVQRDLTTDMMEASHHKGARKAYTLVSEGSRLRIAIDYDSSGKPAKLSITDILNGQVEMADITVEKKNGAASGLLLERNAREYNKGTLVNSVTKEPISMALYKS